MLPSILEFVNIFIVSMRFGTCLNIFIVFENFGICENNFSVFINFGIYENIFMVFINFVTRENLFYSFYRFQFSPFLWMWEFMKIFSPFSNFLKQSILHKKWSFPLRIFSVNVTKSAEIEEILNEKLLFLCSAISFSWFRKFLKTL